jgi:hypothetical protein
MEVAAYKCCSASKDQVGHASVRIKMVQKRNWSEHNTKKFM